jgi:predicted DCC family thiol-disulfide oxidoreductase YuxK
MTETAKNFLESISVTTEMTDNSVTNPRGWVLYDGDCGLCLRWASRFEATLSRRGFSLAALQEPWVRKRLGLSEDAPLTEMRLLLADGKRAGGADALIEIARRIWWAWPLFLLAHLPGIKFALRVLYRTLAANRHCFNGSCQFRKSLRWFDWLPLIALPAVVAALQERMAAWLSMWAIAGAIFIGCKWLTWRRAMIAGSGAGVGRSWAYFFAWPGMGAAEFLAEKDSDIKHSPSRARWFFATAKVICGGVIIWLAAHGAFGTKPLLTGWLGMLGIILFLHFGLFDLLALFWEKLGIKASPVMRHPLAATSLAEFWSTRWNTAFNALAHELAFRPLARKFGVRRATLAVFFISGLVHETVISVPARAGFGFPTAYFLFQGLAVLAERSGLGRNIGLGRGFRGWLFMAICAGGPAFWLFHPAFVTKVILPMLQALGAN